MGVDQELPYLAGCGGKEGIPQPNDAIKKHTTCQEK
jgi:hypothetical protein